MYCHDEYSRREIKTTNLVLRLQRKTSLLIWDNFSINFQEGLIEKASWINYLQDQEVINIVAGFSLGYVLHFKGRNSWSYVYEKKSF